MEYHERLTAPLLWWLLDATFALTMAVAVGFYVGPWWAVAAGLTCLAAGTAALASASILLQVTPAEVRVGRARIEHRYLEGAHPLDKSETQRRSGVAADARAHLVLRPYIATAVEITLNDPDDPVPYWLVSSRRPRAFAAAVNAARSSRVTE